MHKFHFIPVRLYAFHNLNERAKRGAVDKIQTFAIERQVCRRSVIRANHFLIDENLVDLDSMGYIVADETCKTKTEGLFVAGDCRTKAVRQVSTAVGDGAVAATNASFYIESLE